MTLRDEELLLRRLATEFCESEVEGARLRIEREGVPGPLLGRAAELGFLGALAPPELGGSGLDARSYSVLLQALSKCSTSLAYYVFVQNSLFIAPIIRLGAPEQARPLVEEVASGRSAGTLAQDLFREPGNPLSMQSSRLEGEADFVPLPRAAHHLVLVRASDRLALSGPGEVLEEYRLVGLRGVAFGRVRYGGDADVLPAPRAVDALRGLMEEASLGVAAMALGIAERAVEAAAQYAKDREAFNSKLAEFQPIAFYVAEAHAQLRAVESYVYSESPDPVAAKLLALDLARRASRMSIQVHGGYGYFEDVGIERLYRDAAALSSILGGREADLVSLARRILGDSAARI
ncbi:MAG: acyl-CoA dehydrogenase family protein [Nitrososphaeria archaeon]|jgi:alkylation response protein AidB-like acyl-CoA dehydrogenase|nr:acyl-CoA/acyl-ACP dehydrogenase [Nitrososphaerota archaeon]